MSIYSCVEFISRCYKYVPNDQTPTQLLRMRIRLKIYLSYKIKNKTGYLRCFVKINKYSFLGIISEHKVIDNIYTKIL